MAQMGFLRHRAWGCERDGMVTVTMEISRVVASIQFEHGIIVYDFQAHLNLRSRNADLFVCYNDLD